MTGIHIHPKVQSFNVPLSELQEHHPDKRLVVGVAIFSTSQSSSEDTPTRRLLLLRRAATEDVYPLMYEIPGGGAETEDTTILDTVVREVREETGLTVAEIVSDFEGFEYSTRRGVSVQFNFMVEVEGGVEVKINPEEHEAFAWVQKGESLDCYRMTEPMRKVVSDAFDALAVLDTSLN